MTRRRMFLKMLFFSIIRRKSRVTAAVFAVAIGTTVMLGMTAISYDIPRQMGREFRSYGANMLFAPSGGNQYVTIAGASRAAEMIPPAAFIGLTPYRYFAARINMRGYTAVGTDFESVRKTSPFWAVTGDYPKNDDEAMIGADVAEFTKLSPGDAIGITCQAADGTRSGREMTVTGIVRTGSEEDGFIFMNMAAAEALTGREGVAEIAEVSAAMNEEELRATAARIESAEPGVTVRLVKRVTQSETAVLSKLQALVWLASAVVLALSMICVGTTMMTVVMERRKEIGLKKALGADNRTITTEFLSEGLVLGLTGGLLGSVSGYVFARAVSVNVFGRAVAISFYLPLIALAVAVAVTIAACLLPSRRAADVEPAVVLRGE
jgi:putative ABC transport system permease protein